MVKVGFFHPECCQLSTGHSKDGGQGHIKWTGLGRDRTLAGAVIELDICGNENLRRKTMVSASGAEAAEARSADRAGLANSQVKAKEA
ncbi:hypothetical protein SKAU_G00304620 [Synaphobranchus kaupii]|uniref:Uncharacterized protein n=1 Tax=Synaphobranchus kaupii TaxID=118154 RepID=A0A9Q1EWC1_SYNKA|nr:hypothetical protein SKAU_G00304620 [Synaphobranchus kaupii]